MAGTPSPIYGLPTLAGSDPISGTDEYSVSLTGALEALLETQAVLLGLTSNSVKRRGKSIIATTESRTNTAYGKLTTPDQVTGVVLPTDALIAVGFQATWQESVNDAARAAIFVGATQLKIAAENVSAAPAVQEAACGQAAATDGVVASGPGGLAGAATGSGGLAYTGDVTTGQVLGVIPAAGTTAGGGPCYIFAAAGTYDISVQFKASSGSVTAKNRKLWVWTVGF